MFNIKEELEKRGLTEESYESLLDDCQKKINKETDLDWSEIAEKYHLDWNGDSLRKGNISLVGGSFVKQYYEEKMAKENSYDKDEYLAKLEEKKRELERAKIQYRDERNGWSKQNYSAARIDSTLSLLEENLKEIGNVEFEIHPATSINGDKELIVMLSDLHIGQTFDSYFGLYNSDVAKDRLEKYLNKVIEIGELHGAKNVNVVNLADVISGSIHKTIAISNRENVMEQIKLAAEYIATFCYELTKKFETVKYYAIVGNHERCDKKEDALHDERYGDIVNWAVEMILSHVENFHYLKHRNLDSGIVDINVLGKTYVGVHGDFDPMSKQGVANLSFMLGWIPYCVLKGHLHYPAMEELSGVKVIQSGSLAGCGDQYTVEKRLNGKPSQTTLVCSKDGIECIYNVELK